MESTQEIQKEASESNDYDAEETVEQDSENFKRKRSKSIDESNKRIESIEEQGLESGELGEIFEAGEIPSSPVKANHKSKKSKSKKFKESSPESTITTNLFVNYIPLEYTDQDLKKLFNDVGAIESAKVMLDLTTGQSKGFGFVKFKTIDDAREAIKSLHGKKLNNKTLVVKYAESGGSTMSPHGTPSTNVYIKGLPHSMTDEQLYTLFSPYGTIIKHKILKDLNSGHSKGQAFVEFEDMKSSEYAIAALNGFLFPDTHKGIVVRFADTEEEKQQRKMKTNRRKQMSENRFSPYDNNYAGPLPTNSGPPSNNLFVYHLPHSADDALLYKLFSPFGAILQVKVMRDQSGKCKGFGFVMMANWISAYNAIQGLNGYKVENKHLQVSFKK